MAAQDYQRCCSKRKTKTVSQSCAKIHYTMCLNDANYKGDCFWTIRCGLTAWVWTMLNVWAVKNASLGELISHLTAAGVRVPGGFATTADAYREFLSSNRLSAQIDAELTRLNVEDVDALAATGAQIRQWIVDAPFAPELTEAITTSYAQLQSQSQSSDISVAVRSSATAEDLPDASFAGQQETFLNVRGLDAVLLAIKHVFASLYNDRAIAYRVHHGFDHSMVALSAGIQRMVRSDIGTAGVMFTLDTESGFDDVVFIYCILWLRRNRGARFGESG